jgi:hypothetical protein
MINKIVDDNETGSQHCVAVVVVAQSVDGNFRSFEYFFLRRDYQSKGNQQRRGRYRIRRLVTDDHVTKNDEVNGDEHQDYMVLLVATLFRTNAAAATTVSSGNLTPWSNS